MIYRKVRYGNVASAVRCMDTVRERSHIQHSTVWCYTDYYSQTLLHDDGGGDDGDDDDMMMTMVVVGVVMLAG